MVNEKKNKKGARYSRLPDIPKETRDRVDVVLEVLSGHKTVTEAAAELGISRVQMQSLKNRGLSGLAEAITPRSPGPVPLSPKEKQLAQEKAQLERDLDRTRQRQLLLEQLMEELADMVHSQDLIMRPRSRSKSSPSSSTPTKKTSSKDPEPPSPRGDLAQHILAIRAMGVTLEVTAKVLGTSTSTAKRRLRARWGMSPPPRPRPSRAKPPKPEAVAEVEQLVRDTGGLVGAESIRRSVPGVSRRQAAAIKKRVTTELERERQERLQRLVVTQPGVIRGFDAMHLRTQEGRRYVLAAGDAAVPYRTSLSLVERYDGPAVATSIERDLDEHGAPLVWRMDRASCHTTPEVLDILDSRGVLLLQGPPRHPGYYGQLERQNREHRAWLGPLEGLPAEQLEDELPRLMRAVNVLWRRPTLGYGTAAQLWTNRPELDDDRISLRAEVHDRAARLERLLEDRGAVAKHLAQRLAIETALTNRGYLERREGANC